jgi:RHS repeat-associated protein
MVRPVAWAPGARCSKRLAGSFRPLARTTPRPFGEVSAITGAASLDYRWPGQWFQLESGLAYNWHRHYDATLGRYTQPDPLGHPDGPSVYGYVGQNPMGGVDPEGFALGDFPPPPPGYNPNTWSTSQWKNNGKWYLTDPNGKRYTVHTEDNGHWRHWDIQDSDGNDDGRWPPNSGKRWHDQKKKNANQCLTDPSGDAEPWVPPVPSSTLDNSIVPIVPLPDMVPMPLFEFPTMIPIFP